MCRDRLLLFPSRDPAAAATEADAAVAAAASEEAPKQQGQQQQQRVRTVISSAELLASLEGMQPGCVLVELKSEDAAALEMKSGAYCVPIV